MNFITYFAQLPEIYIV